MNSYYLVIDGQQAGPFAFEAIKNMISAGNASAATLGFTKGMTQWTPLSAIPEFDAVFNPVPEPPPPPPSSVVMPAVIAASSAPAAPSSTPEAEATLINTRYGMQYKVVGHEMQFVEIVLDMGQTIIAEAGSMMFMSQGINMDTQLGTNTSGGLMDKLFDAGKRVLTGATLFLTTYSSSSGSRETVAFAAPYPGKIVPLDLTVLGGSIICEKHSFLCAARGTTINIEFTRRIGAGFFGGEGFILQRLTGSSMAFIHASGTVVERTLRPGEVLRVDTGCLVAFQPSVSYDIQFVGNIKTALFGGEGLFFVALTGPGKVWLQSLPFSRLADRIIAASPRAGGTRQESGSILGNIGNIIGGDQS